VGGGGGAVAGSSSSKFSTAGKWPLMTRAHLAQAVICTALLEKDEDCGVDNIYRSIVALACKFHR